MYIIFLFPHIRKYEFITTIKAIKKSTRSNGNFQIVKKTNKLLPLILKATDIKAVLQIGVVPERTTIAIVQVAKLGESSRFCDSFRDDSIKAGTINITAIINFICKIQVVNF
jgi:hypothetical protein